MSLLGALNAGASGLSLARTGVETVSHSVANASTPGFSRRTVLGATGIAIPRGSAWIGSGATLGGIARAADPLLSSRIAQAAGQSSRSAASRDLLASAEMYFDGADLPGLQETVTTFFSSLDAATADPADPGRRMAVVEAADRFSRAMSSAANALDVAASDAWSRVSGEVELANPDLATIAQLNGQIVAAGGAGAAADLADQRDALARSVADRLGASIHDERDGTLTVMVGGHALVSGTTARMLTATVDAAGEPHVSVPMGTGGLDVADEIGGRVGGLLDAHATVEDWGTQLDSFTTDFTAAVNGALANGYDRNGNPGAPLFLAPTGRPAAGLSVNAAIADDPNLLAFAGSPTATPGDAGALAVLQGLRDIPMGGNPPETRLAGLASKVGTSIATLSSRADADAAALDDLEATWQNLAAVDLDEEATKLMAWQTAYEAAARVIKVTDETLDSLMSIV